MTNAGTQGAPESTVPANDLRLFDIIAAVAYFKSVGADAASVTYVRNLIGRKQIPFVRIGRKFYVAREAIDRFIETSQRKAL